MVAACTDVGSRDRAKRPMFLGKWQLLRVCSEVMRRTPAVWDRGSLLGAIQSSTSPFGLHQPPAINSKTAPLITSNRRSNKWAREGLGQLLVELLARRG